MGNFNQTIATLQLGGSETAIVVSIVICSVLLLLSVVGKEPALRRVAPSSSQVSREGTGGRYDEAPGGGEQRAQLLYK